MSSFVDLLIQDATVVAPDPKTGRLQEEVANVAIKDGRVFSVGAINFSAESSALSTSNSTSATKTAKQFFNAKGLHLLPGAIDTQVHFREPGFPEKEDLASGTRSAIYGGVTSVFEMPNTDPPTLTAVDVADKMSRAKNRSWCNYAFYVGAAHENADHLAELENLPGVCGVKMFMGSSTGNLVVNDATIVRAMQSGTRRMAVHAEDEGRLKERKNIVLNRPGDVSLHPLWRDEETALIATKKILHLARKFNRKVHILHVTTAEEAELLAANKDIASFEITPQHLTLFAPDCYERLGTLAQMNPPIRDKRHQEALWRAVTAGHVDVLGSDHAPHTLNEKQKIYPETPSGMTGVQTILPLMLHHVVEERLSLLRVIELLAQNPARLFNIKNKGEIKVGYDADLTLVDLKKPKLIKNSWIQSACGWTPYDGMTVKASVIATFLHGQMIMREDHLLTQKPTGQPLFLP